MRLIRGRDFYDGALAYGQDVSVIFVRESNRRLTDKEARLYGVSQNTWSVWLEVDGGRTSRFRGYWNSGHMFAGDRRLQHDSVTYMASLMYVVLAGQLFCGVLVEVWKSEALVGSGADGSHQVNHFWNSQSLIEWAATRGLTARASGPDGANQVSQLFTSKGLPRDAVDALVRDRITIMTCIQAAGGFSQEVHDKPWRINGDDLGSLRFWKALRDTEVFQQISQWVGGILPSQSNPIVEIVDDKIKIQKAGFDLKTSFRKAKSGT